MLGDTLVCMESRQQLSARLQEKDAKKFKEVRSALLEAIHARLPPGMSVLRHIAASVPVDMLEDRTSDAAFPCKSARQVTYTYDKQTDFGHQQSRWRLVTIAGFANL